jgi:adenylate cyclase
MRAPVDAKARQWLEKAIALDPKFAQAYVALGSTYWWDAFAQWSGNPQADLQRASELAHQALALDDSNSSALGLLSRLDWMQRRFDQSVADAERAVAIDPNYASGYWAVSEALLVCVKPEGAISAAKTAMRLDPAGQDLYAFEVGLGYLQMGRQQEAIPVLKSHLAAYPNNLFAHPRFDDCVYRAWPRPGGVSRSTRGHVDQPSIRSTSAGHKLV